MNIKETYNFSKRTELSKKTIKLIRENRNISLREFARTINYTPTYLSDLENGKRLITQNVIEAIYNNFNLTNDEKNYLEMSYKLANPFDIINEEIIEYIIKNDLMESLNEYIKIDKDGKHLKEVVNNKLLR